MADRKNVLFLCTGNSAELPVQRKSTFLRSAMIIPIYDKYPQCDTRSAMPGAR